MKLGYSWTSWMGRLITFTCFPVKSFIRYPIVPEAELLSSQSPLWWPAVCLTLPIFVVLCSPEVKNPFRVLFQSNSRSHDGRRCPVTLRKGRGYSRFTHGQRFFPYVPQNLPVAWEPSNQVHFEGNLAASFHWFGSLRTIFPQWVPQKPAEEAAVWGYGWPKKVC